MEFGIEYIAKCGCIVIACGDTGRLDCRAIITESSSGCKNKDHKKLGSFVSFQKEDLSRVPSIVSIVLELEEHQSAS